MQKILSIDIGATTTRVAEVDNLGVVRKKTSRATVRTQKEVIHSIEKLVRESGINTAEVDGIGISAAGFIDQKTGVLESPPNLPFKNVELVRPLEKVFKKKAYLSNDANAGALAERMFGAAKGVDNFLYLTISSGIGGAAYFQGKLVADRKGNSIEPGHLPVQSDYFMDCGCGGENHWESYASGNNLPKFFKLWQEINGIVSVYDFKAAQEIFDKAKEGDEIINKFFVQVFATTRQSISILIKEYDPELFLIGGSVYLNNQAIFEKYLGQKIGEIPLLPTVFDDDACLIGAAVPVLLENRLFE